MYYIRKAIKEGISLVGSGVLLAALLAAGILVVPGFFGMETGIVRSGSMEPAIKTGSLVYIKKNASPVETGDVIAFTRAGVTVAHRVVRVDEETDCVITRGDHNESPDISPVPLDQVEGKVVFQLPVAGYCAAWLETHRKFLFWTVVLSALIRMARLWL